MFKIGEFSLLARVTVATLRHYEKLALLVPSKVDNSSGYRYYNAKQLARVNQIKKLQELGFPLITIKVLLEEETQEKLLEALEMQEKEVIHELELKKKQAREIEKYIKRVRMEEQVMEYKVVIKSMPEMIVASKRGRVKTYDDQAKLWIAMGEYMQEKGCKCQNTPGHCYTKYLDGEYREDMEVVIEEEVVEAKADGNGVEFVKVEAIEKLACVVHEGPSNTLHQAYEALVEWIEENGYTIDGQLRDAAYVGPWDEKDDSKWVRELMIPVR